MKAQIKVYKLSRKDCLGKEKFQAEVRFYNFDGTFIATQPYITIDIDKGNGIVYIKKGFKGTPGSYRNSNTGVEGKKVQVCDQEMCLQLVIFEGEYLVKKDALRNCFYVSKADKEVILPSSPRKGIPLHQPKGADVSEDVRPLKVEQPTENRLLKNEEPGKTLKSEPIRNYKEEVLAIMSEWLSVETNKRNFNRALGILSLTEKITKL